MSLKHLRYPQALVLAFGWLLSTGQSSAQQSADEILNAIVGLRSSVPPDARTASSLGIERAGSGVIIDDDGLVVTIGYLILEAASVTLTTLDGSEIEAKIVAYDHATGFGLVRATRPMGVPYLELGSSSALKIGDPVLAISRGGAEGVRPGRVVDRRDFAGYWEYLMEDAIFVSPPHPLFGGSALIGPDSKLVGIGSLVVGDAVQGESPSPGNMFVPIDALKTILEPLEKYGRDPNSRRPWIGVYTEQIRGKVFVNRVAEESPAKRAGVMRNDIILKVADTPVSSLAELFRAMWDLGEAGVSVPLTVLRESEVITVNIRSEDRYRWLQLNPEGLTAMVQGSVTLR